MAGQFLMELPNIKFRENSFSPYKQTGSRRDEEISVGAPHDSETAFSDGLPLKCRTKMLVMGFVLYRSKLERDIFISRIKQLLLA